jgi:thymidylate synthase
VADGKISCQLYQRSADIFLGVPFNIASYSLLLHMMAQQTNLDVGEFIWTGGDCHLYRNHLEQADIQLERQTFKLPELEMQREPESIFEYQFEDFVIHNYKSHPHITADVAV